MGQEGEGSHSCESPSPIHPVPTDGNVLQAEAFTRITPLSNSIVADSKPKKRKKFTNRDIPEALRARFNTVLLPLVREYVGTLPPWTVLSLSDKQALVKRVWPDYDCSVRVNDVVHDLASDAICACHIC